MVNLDAEPLRDNEFKVRGKGEDKKIGGWKEIKNPL